MKEAYALAWGDTHEGSTRSLLPPGCLRHIAEDEEETEPVHLNLAQRYLWSCFQDMVKRVNSYTDRFVIFHLGDMLQGFRDVWATKLSLPLFDDQVSAFAKTVGCLIDAGAFKAFFCHGTNFHKQDYCDHEMEAVKSIRGATRKGEGFEGIPCRYSDKFNVRILNKTFNFLHGHSTVQDYPSTPFEREIADSWIKYAIQQAPHADVIIRGHVHPDSFAPLTRYNKTAFFTPCWQIPDDYLTTRKARYYRSLPLLGAVLIKITEEPMPHGIQLIPLTYPPPKETMRIETVNW